MAVSADGGVIIAGAPFCDSQKGAAAVYTRADGWTKATILSIPGSQHAGRRVAISADGNTAVVSEDRNTWVFSQTNAIWSAGIALNAASADVALSGDGNAIALAGPGIKLFTRSQGVWTGGAPLSIPDSPDAIETYRLNAASSGDGSTLVAGAASYTFRGGLVWRRAGQAWSFEDRILLSNGGDVLPSSVTTVATSWDGNTVVLGAGFALDETPDDSKDGAVWLTTRAHGAWTNPQLLGGKTVCCDFGSSIAMSADGNFVFVGQLHNNFVDDRNLGPIGSGGVLLFDRNQNLTYTGIGIDYEDHALTDTRAALQGTSVAISADGSTIVLGAPGYKWEMGARSVGPPCFATRR